MESGFDHGLGAVLCCTVCTRQVRREKQTRQEGTWVVAAVVILRIFLFVGNGISFSACISLGEIQTQAQSRMQPGQATGQDPGPDQTLF